MLNIKMLSFALFMLLMPVIAYSGWVITEESVDVYGNRSIQTTFIQKNVIRYETSTSIVIIDLNSKMITIVFSRYRAYWNGTSEELKKSTISIYDMQMEKMLAGLPKHEQKELDSIYNDIRQKMLNPIDYESKIDISISKTNDIQEIFGYNAMKYDIFVDSVLIESLWHTTDISPYNDVDINDMLAFMKQLDFNSAQNNITQTDEYLDLLQAGMLLKSIEYLPNNNNFETKVTKLREVDIVSAFFLPPENYREVSLVDALYLLPNSDLQMDNYD